MSDRPSFEPLGPGNYGTWAAKMKFYLITKGLWNAIVPGNLAGEMDQKALAKIGLHVSEHYLPTVTACNTAQEAWNRLAAMLASSSVPRALALLRELNELKKEPAETIVAYVNRARRIEQDLLGLQHALRPSELAMRLLAGLPHDYDMVVTVLESAPTLDLDVVITRLVETEAKLTRSLGAPRTMDTVALAVHVKPRGGKAPGNDTRSCWICDAKGHISRNCPQRAQGSRGGKHLAL